MTDERVAVLDALIYGDAFDCAVTFDELWRYSRVGIERDDLRRRLRDDPALSRLVVGGHDFYCFDDRPQLLARRPERVRRARRLERRASRVARFLRHVPFVRGVALTGSAAAGDADRHDDVDMLVIVAAGRLGTAFLFLAPISRLAGRRLFCPNYYISEAALGLHPSTVYFARELAQARTILGDGERLWSENPWLRETFPNAEPPGGESWATGTGLQKLLERLLGARFEQRARRIAEARLRAHYRRLGQDVPEAVAAGFAAGGELRFHGSGVGGRALARYDARRAKLVARLQQLACEPAA
jgi:predicted nucleotidyltransferase